MISFSNTVPKPRAVVVKSSNTSFTKLDRGEREREKTEREREEKEKERRERERRKRGERETTSDKRL